MTVPVLLLLTIIGSALFAGLETGLVSLNRVRLRVRARRGDHAAKALLRLLHHPERLLTSFLVGNTLCNIGGGAVASYWAVEHMANETVGSLLATLTMSTVFLIFSEVAPKTYFRIRADTEVHRFLWFIEAVRWVFMPAVWVTGALFSLITGGSGRSPFVTREELRQLVRESRGGLGAGEQRMLRSVFEFGQTLTREVMLPLPEVISISEKASPRELQHTLLRHRFTRIPLYHDRVDSIVGLVNVFDVLYDPEPKAEVSAYRRPIHVVPETSRINRVLVDLQRRRETMALVVNEFGSVLGIVTVEDIVEEIMGELTDEHEEVTHPIRRVGDGYVVEAALDIDDLNEELGLSLRKDRFDTVGGLVLGKLGRIPRPGETVRLENVEIEVLAVHAYGLKRLKIRVLEGGHSSS